MIEAPVLVIGWSRPDFLSQVLRAIVRYGGSRSIYVSIDGPRNESDVHLIRSCVRVVKDLAESKHITLFVSKENLGPKYGPVSAINWFFEQENAGIILEDDCLPSRAFFTYCDVLLQRHALDDRVGCISGFRSAPDQDNSQFSYSLVRSIGIWGWATWYDRWKAYDLTMHDWPEQHKVVRQRWRASTVMGARHYWKEILNAAYLGLIPTWDYQWVYACWKNEMTACVPSHSLIENLDTEEYRIWGSRHFDESSIFKELEWRSLLPSQDRTYDQWVDKKIHRVRSYPVRRLVSRARRILRKT